MSGSINGMDITVEGVYFVTGEFWDKKKKKKKPSLTYLDRNMEFPGRRQLKVTKKGSKGQHSLIQS